MTKTPPMNTPVELVTTVESGGRVNVTLAGRQVSWGQVVPGDDPHILQSRMHNDALTALAKLLSDALNPELAEALKKRRQGVPYSAM